MDVCVCVCVCVCVRILRTQMCPNNVGASTAMRAVATITAATCLHLLQTLIVICHGLPCKFKVDEDVEV